MNTRKYLVTGGAGFIGSALVRFLVRDTPHHVLVIDKLTYAATLDSLQPVWNDPRFRFERADICDAVTMHAAFRTFEPDAVVHLAAETHVDRSIDAPGPFIQANVQGTFVMLQAALEYWRALPEPGRNGFRFHHVSTDEVFGALGPCGSFSEESRYRPSSPYAASKAASDHLVWAWHHTYGLPVVQSNCSNNFGPFQFPEKLVPTVILRALAGQPIPVYGAGANVRDWLYVEDHVDALLLISEKGRPGQSYNVGANCERTNLEMVRQICRSLDEMVATPPGGAHEQLIRHVADRPGHDFRYAVNADRIRRELGWKPRETFESGVHKTVRWYLENRNWWERMRSDTDAGERLGLGQQATLCTPVA
jgi:dTDP-glucose 4,6-dehydratase